MGSLNVMAKIENLTTERGGDYGRPIDHFNTTQEMYQIWEKKRLLGKKLPKRLDNVLRHIVYLCIDKLVRLGENPYKQDGYDDIQGYASLWKDAVVDFEAEEVKLEDITD